MSLRKALTVGIVSLALSSAAATPSRAVIGYLTFCPPISFVGLGFMLGGMAGVVADDRNPAGPFTLFVAGLLLGAPGGGLPSLAPLGADQARSLGVSASEREAYNSELDEVNAIYQQVVADVSAEAVRETQSQDLARFARERWSQYGASIPPDAFSAFLKVRDGIRAAVTGQG